MTSGLTKEGNKRQPRTAIGTQINPTFTPYVPASVMNFYDRIFHHRGEDDLWVNTLHYLFQGYVKMEFAGWFCGVNHTQAGLTLGLYRSASHIGASRVPKLPITMSTLDAFINGPRYVQLKDILEWAYHNRYLPWYGQVLAADVRSKAYFTEYILPAMRSEITANGKQIDRTGYTRRYKLPHELVGGPKLRLFDLEALSHPTRVFDAPPKARDHGFQYGKSRYVAESRNISRRLVQKKRKRGWVFKRMA